MHIWEVQGTTYDLYVAPVSMNHHCKQCLNSVNGLWACLFSHMTKGAVLMLYSTQLAPVSLSM